MLSLADLQTSIAGAITTGERTPVVACLVGGTDPARRLDIHVRHYEASLTAALRDKFAACAWLVGADFVSAAARGYVHAHPPRQPCIADYGDAFPEFLAGWGRAPTLPYLESFAELEWIVGRVSIAIDHSPLSWPALARLGSERLVDATLTLQPSARYLRSRYGVDQLMTMYLSGAEHERFALHEADTFIEVRGARGSVELARLDGAAFVFRTDLSAGRTIGDAAEHAVDHDAAFEPGKELRLLVESGLVIETPFATEDNPS